WKRSRSSAASIMSGEVPTIGTPLASRSSASFSGVWPPYSLSAATVTELKRQTAAMARALNVIGLMNVQFAIQ
ncbi:hypothetical protein, partial [Mycetohabitans sp. B6]|uniref:hypothetical protein n=1 Tax=Mycetohabitans sp. B6 TaxID=2841843 RepID=UPI001F249D90